MRVVTRRRPTQQMGDVVSSGRGPTTDTGVDTFRHLVGARRPQPGDFTWVWSGLGFARIEPRTQDTQADLSLGEARSPD